MAMWGSQCVSAPGFSITAAPTGCGALMLSPVLINSTTSLSRRFWLQVPIDTFKWWTRLHYCAADSTPEGQPTGWGEHEMDYILGIQADVDVEPNPEEVGALSVIRYLAWCVYSCSKICQHVEPQQVRAPCLTSATWVQTQCSGHGPIIWVLAAPWCPVCCRQLHGPRRACALTRHVH